MSTEWMWGIGILILAAAITYGLMRNRRRTAAEKQLTEAATKANYRAEDRKETGQPVPGAGERAQTMPD
jgi:type II secretory pathway pseudopilin PulG